MSEWTTLLLRDVTSKIGSGATPKGGSNNYKNSGISLIRSQNVLDFAFTNDGLAFIDEDQAFDLRNVVVHSQDILFNITGDSVARCCIVPDSVLPARVNQHVAIVRVNELADVNFIFYSLQFLKPELLISAEIGATRNAITKSMLENLEISLPPLPEQRAIAAILSSLDDKIDLLHRQNVTLEKMAETLFRQWFVHRPEPVEGEEEKEENDDSENWPLGSLDDILSVKGGTTPSTSEAAYWDGDIPWTSPRDITNLNGLYLFDTERKITPLGLSKISSGLLPAGTLLMSSRAPVGVLAFAEIPVAINQGYIAILDDKGFSKEFIYLWLKTNMDVIHSFSNGSTFMEISKSAFKSIELLIPPFDYVERFTSTVSPIFSKIKSNQIQIRTLTALRDSLLPKLMSGEVRVATS